MAKQVQEENSECSNIIQNNFYMDDLSGVDSIEKGLKLKDETSGILKRGGFQLYKWASNSQELLPQDHNAQDLHVIRVDSNSEIKTLGIIWNCKKDIFKYQSVELEIFDKITKRGVVSYRKSLRPFGVVMPTAD